MSVVRPRYKIIIIFVHVYRSYTYTRSHLIRRTKFYCLSFKTKSLCIVPLMLNVWIYIYTYIYISLYFIFFFQLVRNYVVYLCRLNGAETEHSRSMWRAVCIRLKWFTNTQRRSLRRNRLKDIRFSRFAKKKAAHVYCFRKSFWDLTTYNILCTYTSNLIFVWSINFCIYFCTMLLLTQYCYIIIII